MHCLNWERSDYLWIMRKKNVSCTEEVLREWVLQLFFKTERHLTQHRSAGRRGPCSLPSSLCSGLFIPGPSSNMYPKADGLTALTARLPALFIAHLREQPPIALLFLFSFPPFFKLFFQLYLLYLFIFNCQLYHFLYLFLIDWWLLYNIGLFSVIYQHELTIGVHTPPPSSISLLSPTHSHPSRLLQSPSLSSLSQSPLGCKEIQPVHPKGDQSWVFIGRTDAEAETLILWPPDAKSWLIEKDPDVGKDWRWEEKGTRGWHGWVASPTQWRWVWVNSRSWWWTGRPGLLWSMGSWRVGQDWTTELNWTKYAANSRRLSIYTP